MLLLVAQYLLGLWTNPYVPASGFTSNSSSPALDWHYNVGFILGILGIVAIALASVSRRLPLAPLAVLLFLSVIVAGPAGGAYVTATPNPSNDSFLMGAVFLLAVLSAFGLVYQVWKGTPGASSTPAAPTPA